MFLTTRQVQDFLKVSKTQVNRLISSGKIASIRLLLPGKKRPMVRLRWSSLEVFLKDRRTRKVVQTRRRTARPWEAERMDFFKPIDPQKDGIRRIPLADVAIFLAISEQDLNCLVKGGLLRIVRCGGSGPSRLAIIERDLMTFVDGCAPPDAKINST